MNFSGETNDGTLLGIECSIDVQNLSNIDRACNIWLIKFTIFSEFLHISDI